MKKLFVIAGIAALLLGSKSNAQTRSNVRLDASGNYVATKAVKDTAQATGRYYVDTKGNLWPVFKSPQGRLFALRTSKAGKAYRYYLKPSSDTLDWEGN
jgi:hypothetical protein